MSKKYQVVAFVGAFIPVEKLVFQSRFEWLTRKVASYVSKRKYLGVPLKLVKPDESFEWLNTWADKTLDEQKTDLVGDVEDRCDVLEIKKDVMTMAGPPVDLTEIDEEQVLREIEAKMTPPKKEEFLDDATQRLEAIRQEMHKKKLAASRSKITIIKS